MNPMILHIIFPLLMYLCVLVSGLIISICMGLAKGSFNGLCPLYMEYETVGSGQFEASFGAASTCFYTIYMPVVAMVVYPFVMLILYFYVFYRTFTGVESAINLILKGPVLLLNSAIFILLLVEACVISTGRTVTCHGYIKVTSRSSCYDLQRQKWKDSNFSTGKLIQHLVLAEATSWICLIWFTLLILPVAVEYWRKWKNREQPAK